MQTIREFGDFHKDAIKLLGSDRYEALIAHVAIHPEAGAVIAGTGGFRKLRWAREGGGKSGGARVIYFFHARSHPISMIAIYAKAKQESLSQEQKNTLYILSQELKKGKG